MSALGQKQTFALQKGMSALPPKADISTKGPPSATNAQNKFKLVCLFDSSHLCQL